MKKLFLIFALGFFAFLVVLPQSAFASTITGQKRHCVAQLLPVKAGQEQSSLLNSLCFNSFGKVVEWMTNGQVVLPANVTAQNLTQADMQHIQMAASPASRNVLGILYEHRDYGGSSFTLWTQDVPCYSDDDYDLASMPGGWNDFVSSFSGGFYNCDYTRLYADINYKGASQSYYGNASYVGDVMNDQTSSVVWSHYQSHPA